MIIDSYSMNGYDVQLEDTYEITIISPNGYEIKNAPSKIKKHPKWKKFINLRRNHRKDITILKHALTTAMFSRKPVHLQDVLIDAKRRISIKTSISMADVHSVIKDMYVEIMKPDGTWRGFVDGYTDEGVFVDGKISRIVKLLHPLEIENLEEIQIRALKERKDAYILQLFRPHYKPEDDEEYYITRFLEIPVESKKMIAVLTNYGWKTTREFGYSHIVKNFRGKDDDYAVVFQYSLDYPEGKETWEVGTVEFQIKYKNMEPQPCRCFDVDPVVFTETVWEIDKAINTCRIDDEVTKMRMESRQSIARLYINGMGLDNCQILGSTVKIFGEWGIYGVSLKDARAFWWKDKIYICIQPLVFDGNTSHGRAPVSGAFILGDGLLEDPTLSLAISKIRALSDDSNPIDGVMDRQIRPVIHGMSRKGTKLDEIKKEMDKIIN